MTGDGNLCQRDGDYVDIATEPGLPLLLSRPLLAASQQTVKEKASLGGGAGVGSVAPHIAASLMNMLAKSMCLKGLVFPLFFLREIGFGG